MSFSRRAAGTSALSPVAAFLGLGVSAKAKTPKEGKTGKEEPKADDEEEMNANPPPAAAKTLDEDENNEENGEGGDEDDDGDEDGDDDSDERDMRKSKKTKAVRAARMRERARIASILAHPKAAANPNFAAKLALKTNLTRSQAKEMMDASPAAVAARGLSSLMAEVPAAPSANAPQPTPGDKGKAIVADAFTALADKMHGKKTG